jgi:hypothetical protein
VPWLRRFPDLPYNAAADAAQHQQLAAKLAPLVTDTVSEFMCVYVRWGGGMVWSFLGGGVMTGGTKQRGGGEERPLVPAALGQQPQMQRFWCLVISDAWEPSLQSPAQCCVHALLVT